MIVPEGFFKYRTAGRYLIPNITCFEASWDASAICEAIDQVTKDIDTANAYAYACWKAAQGLFQWDHEAWRVKKWMEGLK